MPLKTGLRVALGFFLSLGLTGCAGYRLGPTSGVPAGSRTIEVAFFKNPTLEPRLSEAVAIALRRTLQQEGTYRLETHDDADVIVNGAFRDLQRSALSFEARDILTPRDYSLTLSAEVTVSEVRGGKILFKGTVNGRTTVRAGGDLVAAERQALPLLAQDLARNLTDRIVDGAW